VSDNRRATKCYVLFVELVRRDGTDVILTEHCKSKVSVVEARYGSRICSGTVPDLLILGAVWHKSGCGTEALTLPSFVFHFSLYGNALLWVKDCLSECEAPKFAHCSVGPNSL